MARSRRAQARPAPVAVLWYLALGPLLLGAEQVAAAPLAADPAAECSASAAASSRGVRVFMNKEEALKLAFGECEVQRVSVTLNEALKKRIGELSGEEVKHSLAFQYAASKDGRRVATAYFDVHRVRSLRQTLMIVVDLEGRISRLELLSFAEPKEYIPKGSWYAQFLGKQLDEKLSLKGDIKGVTGATLTARATTKAVRRILAVHKVLREQEQQASPERRSDSQGPERASTVR